MILGAAAHFALGRLTYDFVFMYRVSFSNHKDIAQSSHDDKGAEGGLNEERRRLHRRLHATSCPGDPELLEFFHATPEPWTREAEKKSWHLKGPRLERTEYDCSGQASWRYIGSFFSFFPFFSIFLKGSSQGGGARSPLILIPTARALFRPEGFLRLYWGVCVRPAGPCGQVPVSLSCASLNAAVRNNNTQQTEKLSASAGHVKDKNGESSHTQTHARSLPTPQSQVAND